MWHDAVFTFDGSSLTIYVDGVEDVNPTKIYDDTITSLHSSTAETFFGAFLDLGIPTQFFNGTIASAKIYNRALSAQEIQQLYIKYCIVEPATKYTIIDERLATDYVGGNVMAAELI